jgi:hypothetical protein
MSIQHEQETTDRLKLPVEDLLELLRKEGWPIPKDVENLQLSVTQADGESLLAALLNGDGARLTISWSKTTPGLPVINEKPSRPSA